MYLSSEETRDNIFHTFILGTETNLTEANQIFEDDLSGRSHHLMSMICNETVVRDMLSNGGISDKKI